MSDPRKLQFTLLAIALVLVGMFSGYKLKQSLPDFRQTDYNESLNKFQDALRMVDYAYIEPVTFEKMVDDAIAGLLEGLDPHSFYIPKQEKKGMDEQMAGSFEGIGVEFNILEDTIYVVALFPAVLPNELAFWLGIESLKLTAKQLLEWELPMQM